jgi:hypothetical protein
MGKVHSKDNIKDLNDWKSRIDKGGAFCAQKGKFVTQVGIHIRKVERI